MLENFQACLNQKLLLINSICQNTWRRFVWLSNAYLIHFLKDSTYIVHVHTSISTYCEIIYCLSLIEIFTLIDYFFSTKSFMLDLRFNHLLWCLFRVFKMLLELLWVFYNLQFQLQELNFLTKFPWKCAIFIAKLIMMKILHVFWNFMGLHPQFKNR